MIEIVGLLAGTRRSEESKGPPTPFDAAFIADYARAYQEAGFDRVLIGQNARSVDSLTVASWAAAATDRLKLMIAHRPGFMAPTMAARAFATLDQLSGGRVGVHIITAFSDAETRNDGDYLTKEQRYHRSREYVGILRAMWAATAPIDHTGDYFRFEGAFSEVRPVQPSIPIFWGGASDLGVRFGAELADVYALGPGSVAQVAEQVTKVKAVARVGGRSPRYSMSMRLVIADTDTAAWQRAERLLATVEENQAARGLLGRDLGKAAEDTARRAAEADTAADDPCLWTGLTRATQGRTQVMCLVGAPDTLVAALSRYYRAGIDNFLITGFDNLGDTARIGAEIAPALRRLAVAEPRA
ncbi:LLM class flavin-dependent oxidoreductase [Nitrospirillum sp. BR 11828]|uniref:LLM class flavin-dependent oxidoreductase n=1 Tax=Nitrospirillum sp. BR 11828 TaxID=3104325 RepID=UPI002ACA463F|nr:LLM class flavin-dependent oxidoreductase [Nitrospirillum sp. BR 11828]MDZ5645873.1 LLM class flavin-dependent oxidoreductase [Nitrospirillum sp. BR 11828]